MEEYKFLSAKCITYGRIEYLEEAIESFLKQDYPLHKAELIIVNDYPLQKLEYNHPQIKIYNMDYTFDTVGAKENFATELCKGEIIIQYDDDDIALPNHFKNVNKLFSENVNILHWQTGVLYNTPDITAITWIGNSGIVFRKSAWKAIGGHPLENAGYDMTFIESLHKFGGKLFAILPDKEVSWFYRWASTHNPATGEVGIYHNSGMGHDVEGKPNIIERHSAYIESMRLQGLIPTGNIKLIPKWKTDYVKKLEEFNNKNNK